MPTVLRIGPYRFFFYAVDRNEPRHVHVRRDRSEAKFWLDRVELAGNIGFPLHEIGHLIVHLEDGRILSVPVEWFPRLAHGTAKERARYELFAGHGIHWPDLDEDINVEDLLAGHRSGESEKSFRKWLESRGKE